MTAPPGQLPAADPPAPDGRPAATVRTRRRPGVVAVLVGVLVAAVAVPLALPDLVGLDGGWPFAQLVAFRPWLLVAGAALITGLALLARLRPRTRPALTPSLAGLLVVLLVGIWLVAPRVVADPQPTAGAPLTVLAFNAFKGRADPAALAELIARERPDLVSISEAGPVFAGALAPLVAPLGYRLQATEAEAIDTGNMTALAADRLGPVSFRVGTDGGFYPYVEVTGGALGGLRFIALHTAAPIDGWMDQWRYDIGVLARWCAAATPTIVAGDLNSSLDHSLLRSSSAGCADAADQRGEGLVPTWSPTGRTRPFGPQIDHVLVTEPIAAETFTVHDIAGSDHRAILSRLRLP